MNGIAFIDEYLNIGFTPINLLNRWTSRVKTFMELYTKTNLSKNYKIITPISCKHQSSRILIVINSMITRTLIENSFNRILSFVYFIFL